MGAPFHDGELEVQARLGLEDIAQRAGRLVRDHLIDQHRDFYAALPFIVAAARDDAGRPWATLLVGSPGFLQSPDPHTLRIAAVPLPGDALASALSDPQGRELGLLGIDFTTRRRNRVNGLVAGHEGALTLAVSQSFGNCPRYIHEHRLPWLEQGPRQAEARRSEGLTSAQQTWIAEADTFFIASGYSASGMDVSHRGGSPGFVVVESPTRLCFPDFAGNNYFNTIGNLAVDPRAGLLFVDFDRGSLLQISGRASIDWDSPAVARVPGAQRLITVDIDAVVELPQPL